MTDQKFRCLSNGRHVTGSIHQVIDIAGKMGIGKNPLTLTQTGKIKSQYRNALISQGLGNTCRCTVVLGTGKAMSEYCATAGWPCCWFVQYTGQGLCSPVPEGNIFLHG
jgi:dissimilatory sulfite reductase (desulfoviridin) alpha/beta subunit